MTHFNVTTEIVNRANVLKVKHDALVESGKLFEMINQKLSPPNIKRTVNQHYFGASYTDRY